MASPGYLFQTLFSAAQAKHHLSVEADVVVVHVGPHASAEFNTFAEIADAVGVRLEARDVASFTEMPLKYARLFLPDFLPEIDEFLYLDGDTQVLGDLAPLVSYDTGGRVAAVRDPMFMFRRLSRSHRTKIDGWMSASSIPTGMVPDYFNSGVMRISTQALRSLRQECTRILVLGEAKFHFRDQDLINLAAGTGRSIIPVKWNFPGFLLNTPIEDAVHPVLIHFMSNPRPWEAPYRPWGSPHFQPYEDFADRFPDARKYWVRDSVFSQARYSLQQLAKSMTERPLWRSSSALSALREWDRPDDSRHWQHSDSFLP